MSDNWIDYGGYDTEDDMNDVNARTLARWIAARLNTPACAEIEAEAHALYAGLPVDGPATEFEHMLEIIIDEFGNAASLEHCRQPIGFGREENARLRKVAETAQACADSREFTGREDPHHYRVPNEKLNAVINALAVLHNPELDATQEAE